MSSTGLEHVVGTVLLGVSAVVALGLAAAYLAWVIGGRER